MQGLYPPTWQAGAQGGIRKREKYWIPAFAHGARGNDMGGENEDFFSGDHVYCCGAGQAEGLGKEKALAELGISSTRAVEQSTSL